MFQLATKAALFESLRIRCRPLLGSSQGHLVILTRPLRLNHHSTLARLPFRSIETSIWRQHLSRISRGLIVPIRKASTSDIQPFILPDIGEGINEVVIREWLVKVGDSVKEFDPICEVESDKATASISSRYEGIIESVHYKVGDKAKVGTPLVDIRTLGRAASHLDSPDQDVAPGPPKKIPSDEADSPRGSSILPMLPSVRRMAAQEGVDLNKIEPTGKHGRILKQDVLAYLEESRNGTPLSDRPPAAAQSDTSEQTLDVVIPLSGVQKAMFKTMTHSLRIPHFNYADEINMTRLVEASRRRKLQNDNLKLGKQQVSNLAIIVKMISLALKEYPELNASIDEAGENLILKKSHNIGVAIDTKAGLVVPNIKNVQNLSIEQVNLELSRLRELGYNSKLGFDDLKGATITISNIGAIGGIFGVPVIVSPEIVIGALGRIRKLPRYNERTDELEMQHILQIVWSADHRVVDGATISRFSNLVKLYLEDPQAAILRLA